MHYGDVDFVKYLPAFFEGMREKTEPLKFLSRAGTNELLEYVSTDTLKAALPTLIPHIRAALETKDKDTVCETIKCMQKMITNNPGIGPELVSKVVVVIEVVVAVSISDNKP